MRLDEASVGDAGILSERLRLANAPRRMSLSTSLPADGELDSAMDGALYRVTRRGGYINTAAHPSPVRKRTMYLFKSGSVFKNRFSGDIYDVNKGGLHPVYRYAKPIFIGV